MKHLDIRLISAIHSKFPDLFTYSYVNKNSENAI